MKSFGIPFLSVSLLALATSAFAQKAELLTYKPLSGSVNAPLKPVSDENTVPVIAWGADVATQLAVQNKLLPKAKLVREDNFPNQVASCLSGKSPYLRGTLPMVLQARKAFTDKGTDLVVIYQLSWSNGGDCLVVRDRVKSVKDIKSVAIQLYGPHEHPAIKVLEDAGVDPGKVKFHYLPELAAPIDGKGQSIVSPPGYFEANEQVDAVWVISPDAAALTEGDFAVKRSDLLCSLASPLSETTPNSHSLSQSMGSLYRVPRNFFQRCPEPHGTVPDCQHGNIHTAGLQLQQHLPPTLCRFPDTVLDRQKTLLSPIINANHHQSTQLSLLRPEAKALEGGNPQEEQFLVAVSVGSLRLQPWRLPKVLVHPKVPYRQR